MSDDRFVVRLDGEQAKRLEELRRIAEKRAGVEVTLAAVARVVIDEGMKQVEATYKKKERT